VARWCEQPNLTEDDTNPGHNSRLDDGTGRSDVFTRIRLFIPEKAIHGGVGPPEVCLLGPPSPRTSGLTSHNPVYDPACHQRIGDEHGPAPGHCYIKCDRQQRLLVVFFVGIGGQVLAIRRPAENFIGRVS